MSAGHQFDMTPIDGKAYGSQTQWVANQVTHDWEKTHWMWEGPIEGNPMEKVQSSPEQTIDMTPSLGNDWFNATAYIPIPDTNYTANTQMNRLGKYCELTKFTIRALVILPNEPGTSTIDLYEVPDMAILRMNVVMFTRRLNWPPASTNFYNDATEDSAVWTAFGDTSNNETKERRLYDNRVCLQKSNGRMESCVGVPESGSASITDATYSYGGDMKVIQWGMRDMSLMQKYSTTDAGQSGSVWNGIVIKFAAKYMCRKAVKKGLQIVWMSQFAFLDRLGVYPKPGLYLDRFGQMRVGTGPGANTNMSKKQASAVRSMKKSAPLWDDEACESSIFGPALR